jgi:Fe-S-cluster-containing hydrogenase component 2
MSLSNTCLDCHSNKAEFCDGVTPMHRPTPIAGIATSTIRRRKSDGSKRRQFLKIAGLSAGLSMWTTPTLDAFAAGAREALRPRKGGGGAHGRALGHGDRHTCLRERGGPGAHHRGLSQDPQRPDHGEQAPRDQVDLGDALPQRLPGKEKLHERAHRAPALSWCSATTARIPPCCRACPTEATFKREDGIVLMDFHRCIGCRFCMAACPFGARSFNFRIRAPSSKRTTKPEVSHPYEGRRGKMQLLRGAAGRRVKCRPAWRPPTAPSPSAISTIPNPRSRNC